MKKREIANDRYIIYINNKYYVVNEYTLKIISAYYDNNKNIEKTAKGLNISGFHLKRILNKLQKEIKNITYYEDNVNLNFPLKIQWKITNKCNLLCLHCYLGALNNKELSKDKLFKITDKIINSNVFEVTLTGGEALLVKSLPLIVSKLIKNDIKVNIFTNGLLLPDFERKLVDILGYAPIEKLDFFISLDGLENSHDKIRGKGNFKKTFNNIKLITQKGYRITTNTVLNTSNYLEVPDLYKLLWESGIYKIQISNMISLGRATSDMLLSKNQHEEFLKNFKKILSELDRGAKLLYADMPDEECQSKVYLLSGNKTEYLQKEHWKCSAGIGKCTIESNGDVYCCPFIKNYCLGNINEKDIAQIWDNKKRYEFLKMIAKENNDSRVCIAAKSNYKARKEVI